MRKFPKMFAGSFGVALLFASPAGAQSVTETQGRHCVAEAVTSAEIASGVAAEVECFSTFTEAMSEATGGEVTNAPGDPEEAMADSALGHRLGTLANDYILSVEYQHSNHWGASLTIRGSRPCTSFDRSTPEFFVPSLSSWWNDRISSFWTPADSGNCRVRHFTHANYQGSWTAWQTTAASMPYMNDQTSSLQYT